MGIIQLAVLVAALGQAGTLSVTPPQVVAASEVPVELSLVLEEKSAADATVRFDTFGIGVVGEVTQPSPGRFTAKLTPPTERYPQLLIIRADVTLKGVRRNIWGTAPVYGVQTVKITTKPNARVDVVVGSAHFPSDKPADGKGRVEVAIKVPPGVQTARVRSVDRLGNRTDRPLPLDPPELTRLRLVPAGGDAATSWSDAQPLAVEIFAVALDGAAVSNSASVVVDVADNEGAVTPARPVRAGLWAAQYQPPEVVGDGAAVLTARLKDRTAPGKPAQLKVELRPGPPTKVLLSAERPELRTETPVTRLTAVAFDAKDNVLSAPPVLSADFGSVQPLPPPEQGFVLTVPAVFGGRQRVTVTAVAGAATSTMTLALKTGVAARGRVAFAGDTLRAGNEPLNGAVFLEDDQGNPVTSAALKFSAEQGEGTLVREVGGGNYDVRFAAPAAAAAGRTELKLEVEGTPVRLSQPFLILPGIRSGDASVGVFVGGRSNLSLLHGASATAEFAVHPLAGRPLELLFDLTFATFAAARTFDAGVNVTARLSTLQALAGARYSRSLNASTALYGSAGFGLQRVSQRIELGNLSDLTATPASFAPIVRVGVGVSRRLGPGRVAAELGYGLERFRFTPPPEDPLLRNFPAVSGNLGGVQLSVGYLFQVR